MKISIPAGGQCIHFIHQCLQSLLVFFNLKSIASENMVAFAGYKKLKWASGFAVVLIVANIFFTESVSAQTTNDYRSAGSGNWNTLSTWQRWSGTAWLTPTGPQGVPSSSSNIITIQSPHVVTITATASADQMTINTGGKVILNSGITWTINAGSGTDLSINGSLTNSGTITNNGTIDVNSGGLFEHAQNGGTVPAANWNPGSILKVTGETNSGSIAGLSQTFADFTWDCPSQSSGFLLGAGSTIISGTLTVNRTNTGTLQIPNGTQNSVTVGNFVQTGGVVYIANGSTSNRTLNVTGNFTLNQNTTTSSFVIATAGSSTTHSLNVGGSFTMSVGTLSGVAGTTNVNFNGTTAQTYSKTGGTISGAVNFAINPNAIVDFGTSIIDGSSGTFTLNSGATIVTANIAGLASTGSTGTIQSTGIRVYNTGATYNYNGTNVQVTGTGLTGANTVKINNAAGVTLSVALPTLTSLTIGDVTTNSVFNDGGFAITSTGTLNLTSGTYNLGSTITGSAFPAFATRNYGAGTTVAFVSNAAQTIAATSYPNLTFSGSGIKTTASGTITVGTSWSTTGGTAALNTNNSSITVAVDILGTGNITVGSGTISVAGAWNNSGTFNTGTGTVSFNGSAQNIGGPSTYYNLALSGGTKTFLAAKTISSNLSIASSAIANLGTFTHSAVTLTLGGTGTINTSFGSTSSSAVRKNDIYFSGTGLVNVSASGCTAPTITLGTIPAICPGSTSFTIPYTGISAGVDQYTISGTGITTVTTASLPATPITVTLASPATTGTISFTLTVTNSTTGCVSNNVNSSVTVNILPAITAISSSACSAAGFTVTPANVTNGTVPAGTTYSWPVPSVTGGLTGGAPGSAALSITGTLTNSTNTIQTATYTVTPVANGCTGSSFAVTITINPRPAVTNIPLTETICSGSTSTLVTLTSGVAGATYTWSASATAGVTGFTVSGTSIIPAQTISTSQTTQGTVTYAIVPTAAGCAGIVANYTVLVNPKPSVSNSPLTQTICSGASSTLVTLTSGVAGATFSWTATATTGVTGFTASGTSIIPAQAISTNQTIQGTVTYAVTPTATGCQGNATTYTILVNPRPAVTNTPLTQTICSGGTSSSVTLTADITSAFVWSASATAGVTGFASSGTSTIGTQTISNNQTTQGTVTYAITPTASGCAGTVANYTVLVNPAPSVTNSPLTQTICSGTNSTLVTLTSGVAGSSFAWTASATTGVTGFAASGASTIGIQTISTNQTSPGTVTYVIGSTASGTGCTATTNYTILVNPVPAVTNASLTQTICSGSSSTAVTLTTGVSGTSYSWSATATTGVTGFSASGSTSSIPVQTISTNQLTQGTVTYAITPAANGCQGNTTNYTIQVNPRPVVTNTPLTETICSGGSSSLVTLTSNISSTFAWTASATTGVTGFTTSGTSTIPIQTISTSQTTQGTVTYAITPTAAGCTGTAANYSVVVNPKPSVTNSPLTQTICSGASSSLVTLTANIASTFAWTASATTGVTGFTASGTNAIGIQTISTNQTTQGTVTYAVTPTAANGCQGNTTNYTVVVNPRPTVTNSPLTQTICSGGSSTLVTLTSGVAGTAFSWTATATTGVTGFTANGTSTIGTQTISTTQTTQGTVTYAITPTATACAGTVANYTILVNPKPSVTNSPLTQTICSEASTTLVTLTSGVAGTTFSWTASATTGVTGFTTGGTSAIPAQIISTAQATQGTVTYTITPAAAGCTGIAVNYAVLVNPLPNATGITICQNGSGSLTSSFSCPSTAPSTSGPSFAGTGANSGTGTAWTNPTRVIANDNSIVTYSLSSGTSTATGVSQTLSATQFGFNIPVNAIVGGIEVTIGRSATGGTGVQDNFVQLVKAGTVTGSNLGLTSADWPTIETPQLYGSSSNLWGTTWTASDINTSTFGAALKVDISTPAFFQTRTANVDYMQIAVTYTIPGSLNWYTVSSGGSSFGSGSPLNPVGILNSGLANTATAGTTTFYAECSTIPGCRTAADFVITPSTSISTQPATPAAVCSGNGIRTLSVIATGTGTVAYSWRKAGVPVINDAVISGQGTNTLTLTNPATANAGNYDVLVSSSCGSITSGAVALIVNTAPSITTQPVSPTATCSGSGIQTISVSATGTGLTYSWRKGGVAVSNGGAISGQGTPALTLTNPTVLDAGSYDVVVSGTCTPGVTSGAVTVIVNTAPSITAQPVSPTATCSGSGIQTINVSATGTGLTYSWRKGGVAVSNGGAISGQGTSALTLTNPTTSDAGSYDVVVSGTCTPGVTSGAVTVIVNTAPSITAQPVSPTATCSGSGIQTINVSATGTGLTYSWRKGGVAVSNGGAISGQGTSALTLTNPTTSDAGSYDVVVSGTCTPGVTSGAVTVIVNTAPSITTQPVSPTATCSGSGIQTISVSATGTGLTYLWRKGGVAVSNGGAISGQGTSALTLTNPTTSDAGSYDVVVSGTCTLGVTSGAVTVIVNTAPSITAQPVSPTATCSGSGIQTINVSATGTGLTYLWRKGGVAVSNGGAISGQGTPALTLTNPAVLDAGSYDVIVTGNCIPGITSSAVTVTINELPSITVQPVSPSVICSGSGTQTISVTATGSGLSYLWRKGGIAISNGGVISGQGTATLILTNPTTANAGSYDVVVTGTCTPSLTSDAVTVIVNTAPSITTQPVSPSATCAGSGTQTISVTATGTGLTYSWRKGGVAVSDGGVISGQGTPVLTFTNPTVLDAGSYDVIVSGTCSPSETSSAVVLTVNENTLITVPAAPVSQTVYINDPSPANLTFAATGTSITYQWFSNGSNSNTGGNSVGGGNGGQTGTYTPPTNVLGGKYYYCEATGTCGTVTSSAVLVTITNTNTWKQSNPTNDWNTAANWTGGSVPTGANDAAIPVGNTPYPALSVSSSINHLIIDPGATVDINGKTFTINGTVTGTGTIKGSVTSSLETNATTTLRFAAGFNILKDLSVHAGTTTLANALSITAGSAANTFGTVKVDSLATLASNGNLTIKSNLYGTARVAKGATTGNYITGDVTVERYIPQNTSRAWRLLSIPTRGTKTIKQTWQENQAANINGIAGFGTLITSNLAAAPLLSAGFDTYSTAPSIQSYNSVSQIWNYLTSTNSTPIETTKAYFLYIRGDRSVGVAPTFPAPLVSATTLRTTGTLYQGNATPAISIAAGKYEPVGNIFASAIDFTGLSKTGGISNTFYVWDSKLVVSATSMGGYQTFNGSIGFTPATPGGSYPANVSNTMIESGQAIMLGATGTAGTVSIPEASKTAGNQINPFRPSSLPPQFKTSLYRVSGTTNTFADNNIAVFDNAFSNAVDGDDAARFPHQGENLNILRDGYELIIEARQPITNSDTLFFATRGLQAQQQYKFEFSNSNLPITGLTAFVEDKFLNTVTPINLAAVHEHNFTVGATAASSATDRFRIVFKQTGFSPVPVNFISISASETVNGVSVTWAVAGERNIHSYEIERSPDGRNFSAAGIITANGRLSYTWLDAAATSTIAYYRIKSTGAAGDVKYSVIAKVTLGNVKPSITVSPNPVEGSVVNLQFKNQPKGSYNIRLMNNAGQSIFTSVAEHAGGTSTQILNLPTEIARGAYQLEVIFPDKTKQVQTLFINSVK